MMKWMIGAALLAALSGCNTVEGFGRDLQAAGRAMTDASNDVAAGRAHGQSTSDDCVQGGSGKGQTPACAPGE